MELETVDKLNEAQYITFTDGAFAPEIFDVKKDKLYNLFVQEATDLIEKEYYVWDEQGRMNFAPINCCKSILYK